MDWEWLESRSFPPQFKRLRTRLHCWAKASKIIRLSETQKKTRQRPKANETGEVRSSILTFTNVRNMYFYSATNRGDMVNPLLIRCIASCCSATGGVPDELSPAGKWLDCGFGHHIRDFPLYGLTWPAQVCTHTFGFINTFPLMKPASHCRLNSSLTGGLRAIITSISGVPLCPCY